MEESKVEKIRLLDGRHGEIRTTEVADCDGTGQVVSEHYEEPQRQLNLTKRVIEKRKPVVHERVIESIVGDNVVERKVESIDPSVTMQLREHLGLVQDAPVVQQDPCYATVEDLRNMVSALAPRKVADVPAIPVVENKFSKVAEWVLLATVMVLSAYLLVHWVVPYLPVRL